MINLKKIIEYGLYAFVFLLPWQTRWIAKEGMLEGGYSEYLTYSLYASDIILITLLFLSLFVAKKSKREVEDNTSVETRHCLVSTNVVWLSIGLFELTAFISILVAPDHFLAAYRYAQLLLGIGLFYLVTRDHIRKSGIYLALAASILIQAALAIWQFVSQQSPANKWLGMAEHISHDGGVAVVEAMGSLGLIERWMRAYGSLPHPNILGGFFAITLILLIAYLVRRRKEIHDSEDEELITAVFRENALINLAVAISAAGIFFSFSRSAWLALAAALLLFLFLSLIKRDVRTQRYLLPIILYIGVIAFLVSLPFMNLVEARAKSQGYVERVSQRERASSSDQAIGIIKESPVFGVGLGNYVIKRHEQAPGQKSYAYQPSHNSFLLIASELGLIGLAAFVFLLLAIFIFSPGDIIYRLPVFAALLICLYLDHWLFSLHFGVMFFWLVVGVTCRRVEA